MAEVRLRTVDSFTDKPFSGNPAAVVMLDEVRSNEWMAAVARETNLSDTESPFLELGDLLVAIGCARWAP